MKRSWWARKTEFYNTTGWFDSMRDFHVDPQFYEMPSIRPQKPATTIKADHSRSVTGWQGMVLSAP